MILFVVLAIAAVVAIALVAVGRLTYRLEDEAPTSVYDVAEAVEFVADRLPDDVTAQLSYDDVRDMLLWHLDYLEDRGVAREFGDNVTSGPLVAAEDEGLAYVLGRATDAGHGGRGHVGGAGARRLVGLPRGHRCHRGQGAGTARSDDLNCSQNCRAPLAPHWHTGRTEERRWSTT